MSDDRLEAGKAELLALMAYVDLHVATNAAVREDPQLWREIELKVLPYQQPICERVPKIEVALGGSTSAEAALAAVMKATVTLRRYQAGVPVTLDWAAGVHGGIVEMVEALQPFGFGPIDISLDQGSLGDGPATYNTVGSGGSPTRGPVPFGPIGPGGGPNT